MCNKNSKLKFAVPLACAMFISSLTPGAYAEKANNETKTSIEEALNQSYIYEVAEDTHINLELGQVPLRKLKKSEKVHAIYLDEQYGIFKTEDGMKGYVDLTKLRKIEDKASMKGLALVDKVIEQNGEVHRLTKGDTVGIVKLQGDLCVIVDEKGNEYEISSAYVKPERERKQETASRGSNPIKSGNDAADKLVAEAHRQLGRPYVSGDTGKRGFDCSGLTYYLYSSQLGIKLPRSSRDQARFGKTVSRSELMPGDLLFFNTSGSGVSHAGIYIGNNNMIHASTGQRRMVITNIYTDYFNRRYVTAKRVLD